MKHCTHDGMVALCFEAAHKVKNLQRGQPLGAIPVVTNIFMEKMKGRTHEELVKFCFDSVQESRRLKKETDDCSEPPQQKKRKEESQLPDSGESVKNPPEATSTTALSVRRELKDYLISKTGPDVPQLTVRFDSAIEKRLQPILVQCVSQAKFLLKQCQNFEALKK